MIVVTGQARTGTSLMMRILHESGFRTVCDEHLSFELKLTTLLHADNDWVLDIPDDHALKVLFPHVIHLPHAATYKMLWMTRDERQMLLSQRKLPGPRTPKKQISGLKKAARRVNKLVPQRLSAAGAEVATIRFEDLVTAPARALTPIAGFLNRDLDYSCLKIRNPDCSRDPLGKLEAA